MLTERFLFSKRNRITTTKQYSFLFSRSRKLNCGKFSFYVYPNNLSSARIGIIVAKKTQKKAVHRNKIKRLIRECFRTRQALLKGLDILVIVRKRVEMIPSLQLRQELCYQMERMAAC